MTRSFCVLAGAATLAVGMLSGSARADMVANYRFGEDDPGATIGATVPGTTQDASPNNNDLTLVDTVAGDTPTYAAGIAPGSTLSVDLPGVAGNSDNFYSGPVVSTATDNFRLEVTLNPDSTAQQRVVHNGNPGTDGFGVFIFGGNYAGLYGGIAILEGGTPVAAGTTATVVLERINGQNSLTVNGGPNTLTGGDLTAAPKPATGTLDVGGFVGNTGAYDGRIDNLVISENVPEPALAGLVMLGALPMLRRRR